MAFSIKPSELGLVWLRSRLDPGHELPLGAKPAEYVVPASAVGLALGLVDLLRGPLGLVYPLRPADFAREVQLFTLLACLYTTVIVLIETGMWLRFGWQRAFGTRPVRADLVVYLLVILLGVHPFIITLGTMAIFRGIAFVITQGQSVGGHDRRIEGAAAKQKNGGPFRAAILIREARFGL